MDHIEDHRLSQGRNAPLHDVLITGLGDILMNITQIIVNRLANDIVVGVQQDIVQGH